MNLISTSTWNILPEFPRIAKNTREMDGVVPILSKISGKTIKISHLYGKMTSVVSGKQHCS
jgi:hypothetical protein